MLSGWSFVTVHLLCSCLLLVITLYRCWYFCTGRTFAQMYYDFIFWEYRSFVSESTSSLQALLQTHSAVNHFFAVDAQLPVAVTCKSPQSYAHLLSHTHTHTHSKHPLIIRFNIMQVAAKWASLLACCLFQCFLFQNMWNSSEWKKGKMLRLLL